eukprot:g9498.t1
MEIYVDGLKTDSWTSSGTVTAFETVKLGFYYTSSTSSYECDHPGVAVEKTIELRGVLADSEWLSILEVEILVDDGPGGDVSCGIDDDTSEMETAEAGTLGTVVATDTLYDADLSDANGCDPAGCTASLTRVYVDGALVTTWTSSGTTRAFENISLFGGSSQVVEVTGVLDAFEWLSIVETVVALPLAYAKGSSDLNLYYLKASMPDGAERSVNLSIAGKVWASGRFVFLTSSGTVDGFVTSSGETDGLEADEFGYFTDMVVISGVFSTSGESVRISEVEFVVEIYPGELSVASFYSPSGIGESLYTTFDAFMWRSDSPEATGGVLRYKLSTYAMVDALEITFRTGDTYEFDVELNSDAADFPSEERFATVTVGAGGVHAAGRLENQMYPVFVATGTGDQRAIMGSICAAKKTSLDGVDCVDDGDETVTGKNVTCENTDTRHFDGDGMVVRNSNIVDIDGRKFDQ